MVSISFDKKLVQHRRIADVTAHKVEVLPSIQRREARQIASVGQGVEHDHTILGMAPEPVMHEIAADEAGAAGDQQPTHGQAP